METLKQYLTYDEYMTLGGSSTLSEMPFNLLENEVKTMVDKYTFGRLMALETQENEVKMCMFKLIQTINFDIVYKNGSSEEKEQMVKKIINDMLSNYKVDDTPILYRGI